MSNNDYDNFAGRMNGSEINHFKAEAFFKTNISSPNLNSIYIDLGLFFHPKKDRGKMTT